jgi:hypothetical protein
MARISGIPKDQPIFIDASGWKTVIKHPYGHQTDFKGELPLHKRDSNGKVQTLSISLIFFSFKYYIGFNRRQKFSDESLMQNNKNISE